MMRSDMLYLRPVDVEAPDGEQWQVARLWIGRRLPRWRRVAFGEAGADAASGLAMPSPGSPEDLAAGLVIFVGVVVFAVVLIPLLLFGIELIILGVVIAAGILGRALLARPWVVRATPAGGRGRPLAWSVKGLRRSAHVIDEVAEALSLGVAPAPAAATEALLGDLSAPG